MDNNENKNTPLKLDPEVISKMNREELDKYCEDINFKIENLQMMVKMLHDNAKTDSDIISDMAKRNLRKSKIMMEIMERDTKKE